MRPLEFIDAEEIRAARTRLCDAVLRTPLLPLVQDQVPAEIYLKLENLQPTGSFKVRGALHALVRADRECLRAGVQTASAGNMAQALALGARRLGVPCHVLVPEHAPRAKTDAVERLGGEVSRVPFEEWWRVMQTHDAPSARGHFIHPVCDPDVIAGHGTIGLEILEDLPDVDAVVVPFGGGGLASGIACGLAPSSSARVFACEVETAAPLAASLRAGEPCEVEHRPSFVDGIGGRGVFPEMWPLVSTLLAGSLVVGLEEVAAALRLVVERCHVVAEGAGAAPVAAALAGQAGAGKIVCVVSGGNIDAAKLALLLSGEMP